MAKHEEEVVQVVSGCLPGHVFKFFIQELGSPQSQSNVHYLRPEKFTKKRLHCISWYLSTVHWEGFKNWPHPASLKASSMICTLLISGISWNMNKEVEFLWRRHSFRNLAAATHPHFQVELRYLRTRVQLGEETFPVFEVVVDPVEALHVYVGQQPVSSTKHHVCIWSYVGE